MPAKKSTAKQATKKAGRSQRAPVKKVPPVGRKTCESGQSAIPKADVKKIQGLLKSKTSDGVLVGVSLLESLGASQADYEVVFTEAVIQSALNSWIAESWQAIAGALLPHGALLKRFHSLAKKRFLKRPQKQARFTGFTAVCITVAKPAFLTTWGGAAKSKTQFIDLVKIPAGSFTMGSPEDEEGRAGDENQVAVQITKPFWMGRTVVTQKQWRAVIGTEPWFDIKHFKGRFGDDCPAVFVSWDDAVLFCRVLTVLERKLGRLTSRQSYRLPTEAEWEYACRAGTTTTYSFGDNPRHLKEHALYYDKIGRKVADKKPNPWGLFDMHGNVWEWCADWYADTLVGGVDPAGPPTGSARSHRGGFWLHNASDCRSACRGACEPWLCHDGGGFRVVREE